MTRIVPIEDEVDETLDARIARLADRGLIEAATEPATGPPTTGGAPSKGALRRFVRDRG